MLHIQQAVILDQRINKRTYGHDPDVLTKEEQDQAE